MDYYDGKQLNTINHREYSYDNSSKATNNSVLLPELKSITPQIYNVKNNYSLVTTGNNSTGSNSNSVAKLINRKKSYERLMNKDSYLYNLYRH